MGINIILTELELYHDYLLHHGNELYVLNKSHDDIQTLYERLNEINELYNSFVHEYFEREGTPF
jgi:hypothetical protein